MHFMVRVVMGLAQVMLSAFWFNTSWLHCFWRENCHVSDSHWLRSCLNPVRKFPSGIRSWTIQHSTLYLHSILTLKGRGALMHVQYDFQEPQQVFKTFSFKFGGLKLHLVHYLRSRIFFLNKHDHIVTSMNIVLIHVQGHSQSLVESKSSILLRY